MRAKLYIFIAVLSLLGSTLIVSACQTTAGENAQVGEENPLLGMWDQTISDDPLYMQFKAEGTFSVSHRVEDLEKFPGMSGTYTYEDSVLTLNVPSDSPTLLRCSGETGSFIVKIDQSEQLWLEVLDAECIEFKSFASKEIPWVPYSQ